MPPILCDVDCLAGRINAGAQLFVILVGEGIQQIMESERVQKPCGYREAVLLEFVDRGALLDNYVRQLGGLVDPAIEFA